MQLKCKLYVDTQDIHHFQQWLRINNLNGSFVAHKTFYGLLVRVCVHKAAVPEASRQSKGVNSSLMVGIQQSPVVSLPTLLEPMTEQLFWMTWLI